MLAIAAITVVFNIIINNNSNSIYPSEMLNRQ